MNVSFEESSIGGQAAKEPACLRATATAQAGKHTNNEYD
jgi:hypothetical protein